MRHCRELFVLVVATCVSFMLLLTESLFSGILWSAFAYFINLRIQRIKEKKGVASYEGCVVLHDFLYSYEYT